MQRKVKLAMKRETKGAVLFEEIPDVEHENALNTMYVRKTTFRGQIPQTLTVTLEW